jgi:translation initiation factor 2 subunit 3
MVGHVDHGKTTLTQALSGVWTDTHSEERKRGISIKLGYADTAFYRTSDGRYYARGKHPDGNEDSDGELLRVVSFVDAPGHETLMAVMISGASIMDGAMLLISATEKCPQPQTREHLAALQIAGIENIVVVQNKIDIVSRERAVESHEEIRNFLKGTIAESAPIIPVSAHHDVNLDVLIQAIEDIIPTPDRSSSESGLMYVARSFDTNRPGSRPEKLQGGIIGGSIVEGSFSVGDSILIAERQLGSPFELSFRVSREVDLTCNPFTQEDCAASLLQWTLSPPRPMSSLDKSWLARANCHRYGRPSISI